MRCRPSRFLASWYSLAQTDARDRKFPRKFGSSVDLMSKTQPGGTTEPARQAKEGAYARYVLAVLGVIALLDYYDRNLISILVEPLERGLHLNDTQIGLLTGVAFALAYGVCGLPIARLADRYGRVRILTTGVVVWSAATVLTAQAAGFATMALARAGVALGEAAVFSTTQALVAEYFPLERRGTALSIIGVCGGLGFSLAFVGGGLLNGWLGWRGAFLLSGAPGLVLAVLLWFTVRDPKRSDPGASPPRAAAGLSHRSSLLVLAGRRSYLYVCIGLGFAAIGAYAQTAWAPAFLMRTYHLSTAQVGSYYSAAVGPATLVSIFFGGVLNDWLLRRRHYAGPVWILIATFGLSVPLSLVFYLTHSFMLAMVLTLITTVLGGLWVAPFYAIVQNLAGPDLRAFAAAVASLIINVVGLSAGPYLGGLVSDWLAPSFGIHSLGISLSLLTITYVIGVVLFLLALRTVEADVAQAEGHAILSYEGESS
jgi:MFS family permease